MNSIAYNIGYYAGILARIAFFAAIFLIILLAGKSKRATPRYDERQIAARNSAYKAGYLTLIGYLLVYAVFDSLSIQWCTGARIGILIGILLSITVFAVTAVRHDAYFGFNENIRTSSAVLSIIAALNLFTGIMPLVTGETVFMKDGLVGTGELSFCVTFAFIVILATLIMHNKKADILSEEEEK